MALSIWVDTNTIRRGASGRWRYVDLTGDVERDVHPNGLAPGVIGGERHSCHGSAHRDVGAGTMVITQRLAPVATAPAGPRSPGAGLRSPSGWAGLTPTVRARARPALVQDPDRRGQRLPRTLTDRPTDAGSPVVAT